MAAGKKSFVLYSDLIHTIEKMPSEKAGDLFKHILRYVNDQNPITDDLIIELTFEPIKQQLKRDLEKWETEIKPKRSESGKLGGIKSGEARRSKMKQNEANASITKQTEANEAVNVNVNVNVTNNSIEHITDLFISKAETWSTEFAKIEAEKFFNFYTSKNWLIGNNKMKSVSHAVANWILRVKNPVLKNAPRPFDPSKVIW
jgi:hypothetical protein